MAPKDKVAEVPSILTLASIVVVIAALYVAKTVLVPITLAVLLSFLLSPVCGWLEQRGLGRIPAVIVTALLGFTVLVFAVWTVAVPFGRFRGYASAV
jgi:predicted PurR-regulated permease PerM